MRNIIHDLTRIIPEWRPRVAPVKLETATEAQRAALRVTPSNTGVSDYLLVLAHDPESLAVRSPLFNAIMYGKGGLSRTERELSAVAASIVNGCIYCAAVHATRHAQLDKSGDLMDTIVAGGEDARLDRRNQAIFDFARRLSRSPSEATGTDMATLRDAGVSDEEIVDLILSGALFGWANRLMHVLGDPVRPEATA